MLIESEEFLGFAEDDHLSNLPQATRTGRPAGEERFVEKNEKLTDRDLSKGRLDGRESVLPRRRYHVPRIRRAST